MHKSTSTDRFDLCKSKEGNGSLIRLVLQLTGKILRCFQNNCMVACLKSSRKVFPCCWVFKAKQMMMMMMLVNKTVWGAFCIALFVKSRTMLFWRAV